jgi:hypothetical protein
MSLQPGPVPEELPGLRWNNATSVADSAVGDGVGPGQGSKSNGPANRHEDASITREDPSRPGMPWDILFTIWGLIFTLGVVLLVGLGLLGFLAPGMPFSWPDWGLALLLSGIGAWLAFYLSGTAGVDVRYEFAPG